MKYRQLKKARKQLDETLQVFLTPAAANRPSRGWIRAIRDALGMNMRQLSHRLGVSQSRISKIEEDELSGSLTVKTLEKVADQLDCVFVYGFAPRTTLENTARTQAARIAMERMNTVSHHMYLEAQELSDKHAKEALENMIEEILESPSKLWDKIYK
ncbi:MAG: mobile mystery protein A [Proteobacteria bacterium]|nr:mobile mystery protein A [Pseudomonadota bacterium]MBU1387469.1 mobile mystery protein A [Pseudomonadota bacterium]MBU1541944.1 mobile mystery protein A [Pseudomonadota bacterium]MBU2431001.1 mobile mystery protein A [Pseudomonadota bacterium]MBU2481756.1 mobile mystery protein A [Pseudomonadota bacterium]